MSLNKILFSYKYVITAHHKNSIPLKIKGREGKPGRGMFIAAVTLTAVVTVVILKVIGRSTEVNKV